MICYHPQRDDDGRLVVIKHPHQPSALPTWSNRREIATVTPGAPMPLAVGDIEVSSWKEAPVAPSGWESLTEGYAFEERPFHTHGKNAASGAIIIEVDGRVWLTSPSNQHGGYHTTFPKGTVDAKLSLRATALKEVYEETGLQIELTGFLCDSDRSLSWSRFYLARRLRGNPADMGWETQAVHLVPAERLSEVVRHPNDQPVLAALRAHLPRKP